MQITFNVPDDRAAFLLELLRGLPYVTLQREAAEVAVEAEQDTTAYLLASPANAAHLRRSIEQLRRGEGIPVEVPAE